MFFSFFKKNPASFSVTRSLTTKLLVLTIGIATVGWFGWTVQESKRPSNSHLGSKVTQDVAGTPGNPNERHLNNTSQYRSGRQMLDINRATRREFQSVPGIGQVLADRIISHRESKGLFFDIEELQGIRGISEATLSQVRSYLKVNPPPKVDESASPE